MTERVRDYARTPVRAKRSKCPNARSSSRRIERDAERTVNDGRGRIASFGGFVERHDGREGSVRLVNGKAEPQLTIAAGQVERCRIINASSARYVRLSLGGAPFRSRAPLAREYVRVRVVAVEPAGRNGRDAVPIAVDPVDPITIIVDPIRCDCLVGSPRTPFVSGPPRAGSESSQSSPPHSSASNPSPSRSWQPELAGPPPASEAALPHETTPQSSVATNPARTMLTA